MKSRLDPRPLDVTISTSFQNSEPNTLATFRIDVPVLTEGRGEIITFAPDFSGVSAEIARELRWIADRLNPTQEEA